MTLAQLVTRLQLYYQVNSSQGSDDVSTTQWNDLIQEAYNAVWQRIRNTVSKANLLSYVDKTWTAGSQTYTLPTELKDALLYDFVQIDSVGTPLGRIQGYFESRNVFRLNTFSAVSANPFTFRIYFIPQVEILMSTAEPQLIPSQHHEAIVWEALINIKMLQDKQVPADWYQQREGIEMMATKELAVRPLAYRANVVSLESPVLRPSY